MSFHSLARSGATSLLVLAACSTAPSPPPVPGEPFTQLVNQTQGFTDGSLLTALTDRSGGTWVGGNVAILLHRPPGGSWTAEPIPIEGTVTALWQDDAGRILAAAGTQLLARSAITGEWEAVPIPASVQWLDLWGLEGGPTFLAGVGGTILREDGGVWAPSETGVSDEVWGIAGDTADELVAVGQNGLILESEDGGETWQRVVSPTNRTLFAVAADGAGRLVAVGGQGTVLLRDGDNWEATASPTDANLFEVRSAGPGRFIVAGDAGVLFEGDGLTWQVIDSIGASENLRAITGPAGGRIVAGWYGAVMDEAQDWATVVNGSRLYAVHAPADGNAMVVGQGGVAFERVAGTWQPRIMPGNESFYALAGPRGSDRLAVGDNGTVLRYDGSRWNRIDVPATELLRSVWYDGHRALVVGEAGVALVMEGGNWRRVATGTDQFLRDVGGSRWEHLFAVGDGGTVLRFNGDGFYPETGPDQAALRGVITRRNGESWMVGEGGLIYRREGSIWKLVLPPTLGEIRAVHEVDGVLYIAGQGGLAWYRDDAGQTWVPMASSLPGLWLALGGIDELLAVGEFGTIAGGAGQAATLRRGAPSVVRGDSALPAPH